MGIPRLTRDLLPYLESVTVGENKADSNIHIKNLVLDGPSVVYHVYGRLAYHKSTTNSTLDFPSYAELNNGVVAFLSDLEATGAVILKIFFDGALPKSKRTTRLERLEKSRQTLAAYRQAFPVLKFEETSLSEAQIAEALWGNSKSTNFTPPFIVPSAIERLRETKWAHTLAVVPGEAEAYCVPYAVSHDAAILTNDSDLVVYPELVDGVVVLLHSLDLTDSDGDKSVEASCWRPRSIAKSIGVKDLLTYAYFRSKDPAASFAVVVQQAKTLEVSLDFREFNKQFVGCVEDLTLTERLSGLDPRLSELICQVDPVLAVSKEDDWQITLPILFEDPGRDSSWFYGQPFRAVAYNLLVDSFRKHPKQHTTWTITELQRRGHRVVQEDVDSKVAQSEFDTVVTWIEELVKNVSQIPEEAKAVLSMWALKIVLAQKEAAGKAMPSKLLLDHYLKGRKIKASPSSDDGTGWTAVHLHANVQAVIYSLRILQQTGLYLSSTQGVGGPIADFMAINSAAMSDGFLDIDIAMVEDVFPDYSTIHTKAVQIGAKTGYEPNRRCILAD